MPLYIPVSHITPPSSLSLYLGLLFLPSVSHSLCPCFETKKEIRDFKIEERKNGMNTSRGVKDEVGAMLGGQKRLVEAQKVGNAKREEKERKGA